jgi:pyruvate/2-oxoglutarate dehydrogenase complex dihydrolipoamide dehydrogenase (E3) component
MAATAYDLAILGGGAAGLAAADFAVSLGLRVAIIDRQRLGGDCTWSGCIPSKTLLKHASVAQTVRRASEYGINAGEPAVDFPAVMARVHAAVAEVYAEETPEALREKGIDVALGEAAFTDRRTLRVGSWELTARRYLVATGARPVIPPITGLRDVPYLTYETVWELTELPAHLIVLGGGPIGCELAQAFRRLGSEVTLVEAAARLLPLADAEAAEALAGVFQDEGISLHLGQPVTLAAQVGEAVHLIAGDNEITGSTLLVALGRGPVTAGLGLEAAGVAADAKGIQVDRHLRTANPRIYAAGDCLGGYQFTHYAGWQGVMAVRNAFLPMNAVGLRQNVPWVVFTEPEVAQAGLAETRARDLHGDRLKTLVRPLAADDRAHTDGVTTGFVKLLYLENGRLLGVSLVASRAAEMLQEWVIALERGLKVGDLADVIHVYPGYAFSNQEAAYQVRMQGLLEGRFGGLLRRLAGGR